MEEKRSKKDQVVYTSQARKALRGVRASASAWGWCWITASDGTHALYVSAGVARRHRAPDGFSRAPLKKGERPPKDPPHVSPGKGYIAFTCLQCGYVEHSLICHEDEAGLPPRPMLCTCCKEDTCALHALALQDEWGINLGWRRPASVGESEFYTRRDRLLEMGRSLDDRSGMGKK